MDTKELKSKKILLEENISREIFAWVSEFEKETGLKIGVVKTGMQTDGHEKTYPVSLDVIL